MTSSTIPQGDLELHGRIMPASNATFLGEIDGVKVVYKPVAGERPLWDFPDGTLADREVAAYAVSEAIGLGRRPDDVAGRGAARTRHAAGVAGGRPRPGGGHPGAAPARCRRATWRCFDALDDRDRAVTLIHEDTEPLRRMAIFDVVVNNADRKGGHVLEMPGGHRYGVDHGVTHAPRTQAPHRAVGLGRRRR